VIAVHSPVGFVVADLLQSLYRDAAPYTVCMLIGSRQEPSSAPGSRRQVSDKPAIHLTTPASVKGP